MGNERPLATKQLKLLGVMLSWSERDEISVPHGASNEKRIIGVVSYAPANARVRSCRFELKGLERMITFGKGSHYMLRC